MQLDTDARVVDLERRLAAERTKRLIAEQCAAELRHAMTLLVRQLKAAEAGSDAPRTVA